MKGNATPLANDTALVNRLNAPLKELLGEKMVVTNLPAVVGSEDAHLLLGDHQAPVALLLVGIVDPPVFAQAQKKGKLMPYAGHNPNYIVDEKSIPLGTRVATTMVMEMMARR
jgi:hippurate hydrolase